MTQMVKKSLIVIACSTASIMASNVLATVNGTEITTQDAEVLVNTASPKMHFGTLDSTQQNMVKERLIEKVLFSQLAKKEGIEKKQAFIDSMQKVKEELLVSVWMKTQMDNTLVSDSEAKDFYEKNSQKFMQKEKVHAKHILVKEQKEAESLIAILKGLQGEELQKKFIELAKTKSTGPSAPKGGDLGFFAKGQMVPAFSKAVWALEVGKVTLKPVKTRFGYHLIYLEEKQNAKVIPYDQVKKDIIASLKQKQFSVKITEVAKELKKKAKIVDFSKANK